MGLWGCCHRILVSFLPLARALFSCPGKIAGTRSHVIQIRLRLVPCCTVPGRSGLPVLPGSIAGLSPHHPSVCLSVYLCHYLVIFSITYRCCLCVAQGLLLNPPGVLLRIWADLGLEIQAAVGLVGYWIGHERVLHPCRDPPPPLPCCRTWKLTAEVLLQCMEMGAKW